MNVITLPKRWQDYLLHKPETGMGYQVVDITLATGKKYESVKVIQSAILAEVNNSPDVPFDPEDIVDISVRGASK